MKRTMINCFVDTIESIFDHWFNLRGVQTGSVFEKIVDNFSSLVVVQLTFAKIDSIGANAGQHLCSHQSPIFEKDKWQMANGEGHWLWRACSIGFWRTLFQTDWRLFSKLLLNVSKKPRSSSCLLISRLPIKFDKSIPLVPRPASIWAKINAPPQGKLCFIFIMKRRDLSPARASSKGFWMTSVKTVFNAEFKLSAKERICSFGKCRLPSWTPFEATPANIWAASRDNPRTNDKFNFANFSFTLLNLSMHFQSAV